MTVSYSDSFIKLLCKWNGSLWKSIWKNLLIYLFLYYALNIVYRVVLNDEQKRQFLLVVDFCLESEKYIPLNFLLGFFVSSILVRWWSQCQYISYPDATMMLITTYLQGEKYLILRRTIARWLNLTTVLNWRSLCSRTLNRFPTMEHLVSAGLMTEGELKTYESTEGPHGKWFIPLQWINNLLEKCKDNNLIDTIMLKHMTKEIYKFRMGMVMLKIFEWISIPLVYTQVVAIATYGFFAITLISRQITGRTDKPEPDIIIPIFTILQFLFYMGWFTVGEDLINPLGDDDDDFELNYVLDRNVQIAYMLADQVHGQLPPLKKDVFWGESNPLVPYTRAASEIRENIFAGHLADFKVKEDDQRIIDPSNWDDDEFSEDNPLLKFRRLVGSMRKDARDREQQTQSFKSQSQIPKPTGPPFTPKPPMSLYIDE